MESTTDIPTGIPAGIPTGTPTGTPTEAVNGTVNQTKMEMTTESFNMDNMNFDAYGVIDEFATYYVVSMFMLAIIIIGGNIVTLICFIKYRKLHLQRYALVCSLAMCDLLVGIGKGIDMTLYMNSRSEESPSAIKIYTSFIVVSAVYFVSIMHLVMISMDRWIAVMFPLRYPTLVTAKTTAAMIIIAWAMPLISVVSALISVFRDNLVASKDNMYSARNAVITLSIYFLITGTMLSTYGKIWYVARIQRSKIAAQQLSSVNNTAKKSDTNKTLLIVLFSYMCLYFPYTCVAVISLFGEMENIFVSVLVVIAMGCNFANSGINVFIYALFTRDFRSVLYQLFRIKKNDS
jgi:hypothetical protein